MKLALVDDDIEILELFAEMLLDYFEGEIEIVTFSNRS